MRRKPKTARRAAGSRRLPSVSRVSGWSTTIPAFLSAMMPRKSPIPAEIASFCEVGIASTTHSRTLVRVRRRKRTPEMKTAPSATSQVCPMPFTTP